MATAISSKYCGKIDVEKETRIMSNLILTIESCTVPNRHECRFNMKWWLLMSETKVFLFELVCTEFFCFLVFTVLCWFLPCTNQPELYICLLPLEPPSHPPSHPSRSSQSVRLGSLCYTATSHQLSILCCIFKQLLNR